MHLSQKDYLKHCPWWLILFALTLFIAIIALTIILFFIFTKGDNVNYCNRYINVLERYHTLKSHYPASLKDLHTLFQFKDDKNITCTYSKKHNGFLLSTDIGFGTAFYPSDLKRWIYD